MGQQNREDLRNSWEFLKKFTSARISLGRAGVGVPTKHLLEFQLAHARARDAVHAGLNVSNLQSELKEFSLPSLSLKSQAYNRLEYLKNPDLGRRLDSESIEKLEEWKNKDYDLCVIVGDGLSARAVQENVVPFLREFLTNSNHWIFSPIIIVEQARVAISDPIGEILRPKLSLVLIGERPGLSSPDSMGLYLTYRPRLGRKDSERNCISNIRKEGLSWKDACSKTMFLIEKALTLQVTGVQLKDNLELPDSK